MFWYVFVPNIKSIGNSWLASTRWILSFRLRIVVLIYIMLSQWLVMLFFGLITLFLTKVKEEFRFRHGNI